MFCAHCGSEIPDNSAVCAKCGAILGKVGTAAKKNSSTNSIVIITCAVIVAVAITVTVFKLLGIGSVLGAKSAPPTSGGPTGNPAVSASPARKMVFNYDFNALASSTERTSGSTNYWVGNMFDGNLETSWAEGVRDDGIGQYVQVDFKSPVYIEKIGIIPGYFKYQPDSYGDRFRNNNRVRSVEFLFNGSERISHTFEDKPTMQYVAVDKQQVNGFRMVITGIYPGLRWQDTNISEMEIWGK